LPKHTLDLQRLKMAKIKNYIVLKNYNLTDGFFVFKNMEETHNKYMQMEETLVESAHLFVKDLDEIIVDRKTVKHDQIMFKDHMRLLDERFHAESCNILYCDLDVVFTRPIDIFGKYTEFSMLENQCGIRYYPHTMSEHLWNIQRTLMHEWNEAIGPDQPFWPEGPYNWQREQDIYCELIKDILGDYTGLLNETWAGVVKSGWSPKAEQLREFFTNIHCVYNEYPTDGFHPGIIHYNGTATAFDPVSTGKQLLNLAKNEDLDGIKALMSLTRYVKRITPIFPK
jgi:hypothetical protein